MKTSTGISLCVLTIVFLFGFECVFCDLEEDFRVLSKQVSILLDKRKEDVKIIEEHMKKAIFEMPEIVEMRNQIKKLRSTFQQNAGGSEKLEKNDILTIKWLYNSVEQLKTEVSEIQESLNSSKILENHERAETKLTLLRSDMSNLNAELETARIRNAKYEAELQMLKEELDMSREKSRNTAEMCGKLKNQLKTVETEWNQNWKILNEKSPSLESEISSHPARHQRIMKQHIIRLEKSTKTLHKENYSLKSQIMQMDEELKSLQKTLKWKENVKSIQSDKEKNIKYKILSEKINNLTEAQISNTNSITNLTQQLANFDKLHLSMLELLENVETIENKVDKTLPEFRKEISKLEVQITESSSSISLYREDQKNMIDSMKAIGFSVSNMQDKTAGDHEQLKKIEELVNNLVKSNTVQTSKLHDYILKEESSSANVNATKATIHLVQELKSFESEYKSIVNKLPKDCGSVDGPPGIYLISPGESEPILAHCEDGWTTIQKRYDGSIDFNRNWNEYSNGFGSATGEHWLGNRNLHYLTKMNCTQLQINMKDIYNHYWQANYKDFRVSDYSQGFKLYIDQYHGNASDALNYQNNMEFSTIDNDRDISNTHCASNYEGGWWFSHCQHANLNGRYNLGLTWFDSGRNEWIAVATSEMKIKRMDVC
ncbi:protein scabrous [Diorhabda sublineata]|uniref:protein scabrous n=1 Tax=Diorhabda sublineata TaxID=1163346 RepID=UPI0024E1069E|nr:protein scabrous [Diorhabda sublineata]